MKQATTILAFETPGRGLTDITRTIARWQQESGIGEGLLTMLCRHTSASLLIQENAADTAHFRFTHGAPEDPELLWFETPGARWRSLIGFKSARTKQVAMKLHTLNMGAGLSFAAFEGRDPYRLILTATPVDDTLSDLRVSYFLPRDPASPDRMPQRQRDFARHTIELFEQDARIWRHQVFVQRPVFARQDIAGYTALRRWSEQFYEAPEGQTPTRAVVEL